MKSKRYILIIIVIVIIQAQQVCGAGVRYPVTHDVVLYNYGNRVIEYYYYSMKYALMNNSYSLVLANRTLRETTAVYIEEEFYKSRGINTKSMKFVEYIHKFSRDSLTLTLLLLRFKRGNKSKVAPGVLAALKRVEADLKGISNFPLYNGSERLYLHVKRLRILLNKISNVIEPYFKKQLPKQTFFITADTFNTYINQSVLVFGSAPQPGKLELLIKGERSKNIVVNLTTRTFSIWLKFDLPGKYVLQAIEGENQSNTIEIKVGKIPTKIVAPSQVNVLIGQKAQISAILVDASGRPLSGFLLYVNGKIMRTDIHGKISINVYSNVSKRIDIIFEFRGGSLYLGSKKRVLVFFGKKPVHLYLEVKKPETEIGKNLTLRLIMTPSIEGYVRIYVNGSLKKAVLMRRVANVTLQLNREGTWVIRACFNGTEDYAPACSNTVSVKVKKPSPPLSKVKIVMVTTIILGLFMVVTKFQRETRTSVAQIIQRSTDEVSIPLIPNDVGEAYTLIKNMIMKKYRLPSGSTPREILRYLRDFSAKESLEKLTEMHELQIYGGRDIDRKEFFQHVEKVVRVILR